MPWRKLIMIDNELVCYNTDNSGLHGNAKRILFPESIAEIKKLILDSQNIVPRGLATNIVGGCIPSGSDVFDMKKMNNINFDFKTKLVSVEAGVTIKELNEKLKSIGYEFPIFGEGTIGGMIAMDSPSFMGAYGNIKEWIEEIEFVNGRAELIKFSKSDIGEVCGLEGITGIIVRAKLSVISYNERSLSIFQSGDIEEIFLVIKRLKLEKTIAMMRLYSPYYSKILGFPEKYHIFVGFENSNGKIKGEDCDILLKKIMKDYYLMNKNGYRSSEDPKLLFEKLKEFTMFLDSIGVPYSGDLSLGIIFPFFKDDSSKEEVIRMINRINGRPGKYGIGLRRKNKVDNLQKKIVHRVKMRHDPYLKMNKGKYIDIDGTNDADNLIMELDKRATENENEK